MKAQKNKTFIVLGVAICLLATLVALSLGGKTAPKASDIESNAMTDMTSAELSQVMNAKRVLGIMVTTLDVQNDADGGQVIRYYDTNKTLMGSQTIQGDMVTWYDINGTVLNPEEEILENIRTSVKRAVVDFLGFSVDECSLEIQNNCFTFKDQFYQGNPFLEREFEVTLHEVIPPANFITRWNPLGNPSLPSVLIFQMNNAYWYADSALYLDSMGKISSGFYTMSSIRFVDGAEKYSVVMSASASDRRSSSVATLYSTHPGQPIRTVTLGRYQGKQFFTILDHIKKTTTKVYFENGMIMSVQELDSKSKVMTDNTFLYTGGVLTGITRKDPSGKLLSTVTITGSIAQVTFSDGKTSNFPFSTIEGILAALITTLPTQQTQSSIGTYSLTYHKNGATGGTVPPVQYRNKGDGPVTVSGNIGNLQRPGYIFTGWNAKKDGKGTHYNPGDTFSRDVFNTTLYAEWKSQ